MTPFLISWVALDLQMFHIHTYTEPATKPFINGSVENNQRVLFWDTANVPKVSVRSAHICGWIKSHQMGKLYMWTVSHKDGEGNSAMKNLCPECSQLWMNGPFPLLHGQNEYSFSTHDFLLGFSFANSEDKPDLSCMQEKLIIAKVKGDKTNPSQKSLVHLLQGSPVAW